MLFANIALLLPILANAVFATSDVSFYTDDLELFGSLDKDFVSHLLSGWDAMDMELGSILFHHQVEGEDNSTQSQSQARDLVSRVPVAQCDEANCYNSGNYQFFTRAQQEFIAGKLCPFAAQNAPTASIVSVSTAIGVTRLCWQCDL